MSSGRLPGKVLSPLAGRPAMSWLLERLGHSQTLGTIAVATSLEPEDDAIERFCHGASVPCYRGPLEDLAARVLGAADAFALDVVVRVNADSPTLDQRLVDRGVELMRSTDHELVTNVFPRSFPPGQSVEVLRVDTLRDAHARMDAEEREHVTRWFYRHPDDVRLVNFSTDTPALDVRLTLDTARDARCLESVLTAMERPHWEYTWAQTTDLARQAKC